MKPENFAIVGATIVRLSYRFADRKDNVLSALTAKYRLFALDSFYLSVQSNDGHFLEASIRRLIGKVL